MFKKKMSVYKVNVSDLTRDFVKYSKYILLCNDHVTIQKYYTMTIITATTESHKGGRRMKGEREKESASSTATHVLYACLVSYPVIFPSYLVTPPE